VAGEHRAQRDTREEVIFDEKDADLLQMRHLVWRLLFTTSCS
jgi:hypothetical protein